MAEPTSIFGFRSPRRRRKALLGVGVVVFGVFIYLIYLMASGPDAERASERIVESAMVALPGDRLSASDIGVVAEALRRALNLYPQSAAALEATRLVAERVATQVTRDIDQGLLDEAGETLQEAADRWPDDARFSAEGRLHAALNQALEERASIDEVATLVAAAEAKLSAADRGDSAIVEALQLLRRTLELDSGNDAAQALREGILEDVKAAVQDALSAGEPERAGRLLEALADEWHDNPDLAALRRTVTGRMEERAKAAEIGRLLDLARQRLRDDRLMTPARDSAAHYYRRVLQLQPNNEPARNGLERVGDRYVVLIRSAVGDSALNRARRLLRSLSTLLPSHPRIETLGNEIEAAERAIAAAAARDSKPKDAVPGAPVISAGSTGSTPPPPAQVPTDDEGRLWYEVRESCVDAELRRYIEAYPAGRYIEAAWRKISSCIESR